MDFGDILNKWENSNIRAAKNNTMDAWLNENEVYDKDADEKKTIAPNRNKKRLLRVEPDSVIDIHGNTSEQAWLLLDNLFTTAKNSGFKKLRIIHGKGNHSQGEAVLNELVRKFIEKCPFAGESGYEKAANGGSGATWVFIK
jgi:DNA-nicking Smr family endonuclease